MRHNHLVLLVLGMTLTVASGALHGYLSQRWGVDGRMQAAAAQLSDLPLDIGTWHLQAEQKLSDSAVNMLQCVGYINHAYTNAETNRQITVTVMVGPGSTMAIHTPEICYESRNFSMRHGRRSIDISDQDGQRHKLWAVELQTNDTNARNLRVYYGWSVGGAWAAPDSPRLAFAGERVLYKMQIAEFDYPLGSAAEGIATEFLNEFLPVLHEHLVPVQRQ